MSRCGCILIIAMLLFAGCVPVVHSNSPMTVTKLVTSFADLTLVRPQKLHLATRTRQSWDYRNTFPSILEYKGVPILFVSEFVVDDTTRSGLLRLVYVKNEMVGSIVFPWDQVILKNEQGKTMRLVNTQSIDSVHDTSVVFNARGKPPFSSDKYGSYVDFEFSDVVSTEGRYTITFSSVTLDETKIGSFEMILDRRLLLDIGSADFN